METRPPRTTRARLVALGALVVVLWAAAALFELGRAGLDLRAGRAAVDRARERTGVTDVAEGRAIPDLLAARRRFDSAFARSGSPVLAPIRLVPVLDRQLRSVRALSGTAARVAGTGARGMAGGREILARPGPAGTERVAKIRDLGGLASGIENDLLDLPLGPRDGLLPPLAGARRQLAGELAELRDGLRRGSVGADALAGFLTGPRRYLVFAANNAEMRAGAGMFLTVGELEVDAERLRLGEMRSVTDFPVPPGAVTLDGDLRDRWGWLTPEQEWRNLMTSPRFDVAGPLAARMWEAAGNRPVDGVLAVDPVALQGLLEATGPVTVDGREIRADSVVNEVLHEQYVRFAGDERVQRQEAMGRMALAVFQALDGGRWSVPGLAGALSESVRGRHVLAWSSRPDDQAGWQALRVDGALGPDSLALSVLNRGANKLDPFLRVSADLRFAAAGPDTEVTLRVDLRNETPDGEPSYVAGANPAGSGVAEGVYIGILAVNIPGAAAGARVEGVEQLAVAGADGPTRVVGFQFQLAKGETRSVVVRFTLPGHEGEVRVEPSARVPPTDWSESDRRWLDDYSSRAYWNVP